MSGDINKLVKRYRELAQIHANANYGDPCSVERSNNAADEMVDICRRISQMGAPGLDAILTLLDDPVNKVHLWAAHHILEHTNYSESLESRALKIIRGYSAGDNADAYGERLWLKEWEAKGN